MFPEILGQLNQIIRFIPHSSRHYLKLLMVEARDCIPLMPLLQLQLYRTKS